MFGATDFLESTHSPECASVVDRPQQHSWRMLGTQEFSNHLKAGAKLSVAIDISYRARIDCGKGLSHSYQHPGQPHSGQAAGARQLEEKNFVNVTLPVLFGPATQISAADQACPVVVRSKISRAWMRDINRNKRNVGLPKLRGDNRRDRLVRLKFDHQIDFFANQQFSISLRRRRVVSIID